MTTNPCRHKAEDLFAWRAYDGTMVICCKACKTIISGAYRD